MIQRWQLAVVAVLLVVAWLIDVELFAILAGVAVAGVVFAEVHLRARARRNATAPLTDAVRSAFDIGPEAPLSRHVGGRPVSLAVEARSGDGMLRGVLVARAPAGRGVPFCFVGQRRTAPISLPPLVANAALFETRMECELRTFETDESAPLDDFAWASSSPDAFRRLLDEGLREAAAHLVGIDRVVVAAILFDGARVQALLVPDDPAESDWIPRAVHAVSKLARAVEDGMLRVAAA